MKENTLNQAADDLIRVATSLANKRHESSSALYRIAQHLIDGGGTGTDVSGLLNIDPTLASNFDPSDNIAPGVSMNVEPMAHHEGVGEGGNHLHPKIDSYVQDDPQAGMADGRKTHTLMCTLKAEDKVSESDMMNYILGISKHLPVDVDSFKWSKSEPKPSVMHATR